MSFDKLIFISIKGLTLCKKNTIISQNFMTIFVERICKKITTLSNWITTITKNDIPSISCIGNIS